MKFLIIAANSPETSTGGIERYMSNLTEYAQGKEDEYYMMYLVGKAESRTDLGNVHIIVNPIMEKNYASVETADSKRLYKVRLKDFFDYAGKFVEENQIDLICAENFHVSAPSGYSIMLNMVSLLKQVPVVTNLHSFPTKDIHEAILRDLVWEKIICVSNSVAGDCFVKGVSADLLATNLLGVNTNAFNDRVDKRWLKQTLGLNKDDFVILHASRILAGTKDTLESKGFTYLIEAFSRLSKQNDKLKLVLSIAMPPERLEKEFKAAMDKLKGYIQVYGVEDKVICKSFKLEEMPLVYSGADLFVLASENETFGQVIIEAMACGVPVVATGVGGIMEIITSGYNGFLVQHKNVADLESKMKDIITERRLIREFSQNGLATIREKFEMNKQFASLVELFKKVAADYKSKINTSPYENSFPAASSL
jgi:glycosyltransferase involved in cell wall biosynthesis